MLRHTSQATRAYLSLAMNVLTLSLYLMLGPLSADIAQSRGAGLPLGLNSFRSRTHKDPPVPLVIMDA